ncbi:hypothetical protein [Ralstonia solanacearum]|uniref:Uncharacterized protein n=1 Tax=Ralstonia solanacearum IPO1609 TaxID=564066 RepID=A0ABF7RFH6_RALSL|nr:hypothetical protein [Ralstonia solanacearum]CEJ20273.1 conserved hypothetical protein [Ralstonia solanacearum IPO1609]
MDFATLFAIERPGLFKVGDHVGAAAGYLAVGCSSSVDRHGLSAQSAVWPCQPDIVSALRGEYDDAIWETLRMFAFAASCAAGTTLVYKVLKLLA